MSPDPGGAENGGYGWGNQIEIGLGDGPPGREYVIVANPDIHVCQRDAFCG